MRTVPQFGEGGGCSVILPTFNRAALVVEAAKSVLRQTYKNLELIIVDDGSTDGTAEAVRELAAKDSRVQYLYQENRGACAARNAGIDRATGRYIAFHDSDDIWHEDKLERQIAVLQRSGADLVFCCMNNIKDGTFAGLIGNSFREGICASSELPLGVGTQTLCADSAVFRAERFDEDMPRLQDFELLLRVSRKFTLYYLNQALVDYSMQEDSISMNPLKLLKAWNLIRDKHPDFCERYRDSVERIALGILGAAAGVDDDVLRGQLSATAFRYAPTAKVRAKALLLKNRRAYATVAGAYRMMRRAAKALLRRDGGG